jgi:hypothetical protein
MRRGGRPAQRFDDGGDIAGAEDGVDLRNLGLQLVAVALGQAAGDDEGLTGPGLLELGHLQNGVHRLLLGLVDERAGVDDQHLGPGGVARQLVARLLGQPEHHLGIDEVLRAPERDHSDLHLRSGYQRDR